MPKSIGRVMGPNNGKRTLTHNSIEVAIELPSPDPDPHVDGCPRKG